MSRVKKLKFLFIHPESENLGIEALSGALKAKGHQVQLLFFPQQFQTMAFHLFGEVKNQGQEEIVDKIREYEPDVICFSPFTSQYVWAITTARFIKQNFKNQFVLFGGVHTNSVPEIVIKNKYVDAIIVGEADYQIVKFATNFNKPEKLKQTASLWIKIKGKLYKNKLAPLEQNLDKLPTPDKDLFYDKIPAPIREEGYMIMGSRGCPFHCSYCSSNMFQHLYMGQKRLRFRSPENIIDELIYAKKHYKPRMVEFFDDVLTIDEKRLEVLMRLYRRKINLPFTCYLHPQLVTERIIKLLAKSNCYWLKLGIQSANEEYRRNKLLRCETNDQVLETARLCRKYKLSFSFDHIFNLPGETEQDLIDAVELYLKCKPTIINFGSLIYLPGTDIIKTGIEEKVLTKRDALNINRGINPVFKLANVDLISYQYKKNKATNISVFALLFMMITTMPSWLVKLLLRQKIYKSTKKVSQIIIIFFKLLTKIRAGQLYIYRYVFKSMFYYTLAKR